MKKNIIVTLILLSATVFSQAPDYLNYQGVARDASNNIITSTIGLKFEILQGSASGLLIYDEINTSLPSSAGIFTAAIGSGAASTGTFSAINWATGPYFIRVSIDPAGGTSFSTVGTSQLLSVPYALYAKTAGSGSSLPTGTLTGQTLYWDDPSNTWIVNNNLLNDGKQVVVGDANIVGNNKMKIASYSPLDSASLFVYHSNAIANESAVRGFAIGNAVNSGSLNIDPIIGGHFLGFNTNNAGSAVGVIGQGISPGGDAVGMIAVASSSSSSLGRSVGLYASGLGTNYIGNYAAIFDKGKVFVNDTLIINTNGSIGDVLTRGINGKSHWQAPGGGGPWTKPTFSVVTLSTNSDYVGIGTSTPLSKLHVSENIGGVTIRGDNTFFGSSPNAIGVQGTSQSSHSLSAGVYGAHSSNGFGVYAINTNSSSATGSGVYGLSLGTTTNNVGIRGDALNGNGVGIMGVSFGTGVSVYGIKTNASSSGNAGKFEINGTSNNADAIIAFTSGGGAALRAANGPTVAGGSNAAIWLENGHLKSTQITPPTTNTVSVSGGGISGVLLSLTANSTDVRGTMNVVLTTTLLINNTNNVVVKVNFNKIYAIPPTVLVTALNDMGVLTYFVSNVTTSSFNLTIRNSSGTNWSTTASLPLGFNYIVIE